LSLDIVTPKKNHSTSKQVRDMFQTFFLIYG